MCQTAVLHFPMEPYTIIWPVCKRAIRRQGVQEACTGPSAQQVPLWSTHIWVAGKKRVHRPAAKNRPLWAAASTMLWVSAALTCMAQTAL